MKRSLLFFCILITCGMGILSCNTLTSKKIEFFYYPQRNVYYDVADNFYIYSLDGGKTWDSTAGLTGEEPSTLGNKQIIYSETPEIWLNNNEHLKQYNGRPINILINDSSYTPQTLVADRKAQKSKTVAADKQPEKKPNFFQRLFGKKNKN